MRMLVVGLASVAFGAASAASQNAQLPAPFKFLSVDQVLALTDKPGPGVKTAFPARHDNYYIEYPQRTDAGNIPKSIHTGCII